MVDLHSIFEMKDIFDTLSVHLDSMDLHVLKCTSKTMKEVLQTSTKRNKALAKTMESKLSVPLAMNHGRVFFVWARDIGCPWSKQTCSAAAGGGHLEILQWARSQNPPCPWDEDTCSA
eukprot:CAMPEP_0118924808 /NCGR_PEP_ID=MMETSP1169-20130426/2769_1 /TAXON_ID=36882 /ORGANISM="Pyramimonas obovata, Strain CCMP722" /LENGTH=117 /DNA_ID=CAMNT_0006865941 /DNA_START=340 /DNA_END=690 /DNA_ORIENTATION=-